MEKLFLGVGRTVITPPIGTALAGYGKGLYSDSRADDLTATAFWFRQGDRQAAMVSLTLCSLHNTVRDVLLQLIEERFGIPQGLCMLSCTHTHSGPSTFPAAPGEPENPFPKEILYPKVLEALDAAREGLRAVTVGTAHGESRIGINRRQLEPDNSVILGQNPWGSYDPKMTVLSFRDEEEKIYANIVHYGCHGTCAGHHHSISRDWSGFMIDRLEQHSGGVTAFFNGTCGDTGPRLSNGKTTGKGDYRYVYEIGYAAGADAVRIFNSISSYREVNLKVTACSISFPVAPLEPLEEAQKLYDSIQDDSAVLPRTKKQRAARVIEAYKNGFVPSDTYTVPQTIVRLGDTAIFSLPFETFSGIGLRVNGYSSIPNVLCFGHTNGAESYLPTQDQLCLGGYEVNMFRHRHLQPFPDNADWIVISTTLENLKTVAEETDA